MESKPSVSVNKGAGYLDAGHEQVTSILPDGDVPYMDHDMDADERVITALGYKQEFKREFSLWTTFCVSFAVLGLLPSFASTLYYGECYRSDDIVLGINILTLDGLKAWDMPEQQVWSGAGS
jgi:hypothetical protein